ncbi:hypothetical protein ACX93W_05310 [Paenibacillus sp. CAU 1782]
MADQSREEKIQHLRDKHQTALSYRAERMDVGVNELGLALEEIKRLQIALYTHQSCDKSAAELYVEVSQLREERDDFKHSDIMLQSEVKKLREERVKLLAALKNVGVNPALLGIGVDNETMDRF